MQVFYAHEHPESVPLSSIFLAGPSPRGAEHYNWRPQALRILSTMGYTGVVFVPLPRDGEWLANYDAQVDWELDYLELARAVAFWIPRNLMHLPGFTTNVEYGLYLRSGKAILGYPLDAVKVRYLHHAAKRFGVPIFNTLEETMWCAIQKSY